MSLVSYILCRGGEIIGYKCSVVYILRMDLIARKFLHISLIPDDYEKMVPCHGANFSHCHRGHAHPLYELERHCP